MFNSGSLADALKLNVWTTIHPQFCLIDLLSELHVTVFLWKNIIHCTEIAHDVTSYVAGVWHSVYVMSAFSKPNTKCMES